jgi:hypothetical protein
LRKLDSEKLPVGMASGCIIDYLGRRLVLSVFHATGKSGRWAIELRYDKDKRLTELYYPGAFNFLGEMILEIPKINEVDFSYTEVPTDLVSYFQHVTLDGKCLIERERHVFKPDFNVSPSLDKVYGFSGQVKGQFDEGLNALVVEHRTYPGLKYSHTERGYHYFKLPVEHPGHDHFKGCSGAPIIDTARNVVALVCGGNKDKNEVYGIALNKYKMALDITYTQILGTGQHNKRINLTGLNLAWFCHK